ncbi:MAG: MBL fold metallo-hydrolase, partial [Pseudomonadota bacterium]
MNLAEPRTGVRFPFPDPPSAAGDVVEVAEGVLWSRISMPMRLDHVNVYMLDDGDGWTVVDTGFRGDTARAAWEALLAGPLSGKPVRRVVVTHHHPDHIGMAGWLMAQGAELWTTRTAYILARMLQLDHHDATPEENVRLYVRAGASAEQVERYRTQRPFNFSRAVEPLPLGYRRVAEGDTVAIGGRRWTVRMGHGHAPEHATFWSRDDALVLAGDQIIPGISSNLGVHATEPDADPVGEWLTSCEALREHAREDHLGLPGHKLPFTGLPTRLDQLIDNHHGALKRLRRHLEERGPLTAAQCFMPVFGREVEEEVFGMALSEAIGHLNHMLRMG